MTTAEPPPDNDTTHGDTTHGDETVPLSSPADPATAGWTRASPRERPPVPIHDNSRSLDVRLFASVLRQRSTQRRFKSHVVITSDNHAIRSRVVADEFTELGRQRNDIVPADNAELDVRVISDHSSRGERTNTDAFSVLKPDSLAPSDTAGSATSRGGRGRVARSYLIPMTHRATPGTRTLPSLSYALTFAMTVARIRSRAGSSTC